MPTRCCSVGAVPVGLDYLGSIREESDRFATAVVRGTPAARVPTCPDWTADDLLWHLAEVQWFWGTVVISGSLDRSEIDEVERPARPTDRAALVEFFHEVSARACGRANAARSRDAGVDMV